MPEMSLIRRRKLARLTANPPQINYLTPNGENDPVAEKLTALAFQQFDRSGEALEHRRVVDSGITFGVGYSKCYWDTIEVMRRIRRPLVQPNQEAEGDYSNSGYSTQLDEDKIKQLLAQGETEMQDRQLTVKYEGPCVKNIFVGDLFLEPGARVMAESGWVVENYWETDVWMQKMLRKRFQDPDSGQEMPVFNLKACEELFDMPTPSTANTQLQPFDLRTRLRTASLGQTIPMHPNRLVPGKRFDILESHQRDEYGMMWITWVGNEKVILGKMPYPWDLYGRYVYSEFVPLPDILNAVGDSTPRLLRWLHLLHNVTVGQRKDLVNAILRPIMKIKIGEDIPDEAIERRLMRVISVKDMNSLQPMAEPASIGAALSAANEEEKQIIEMLALAEPNMTVTQAGSETNPMAGKTATTAILAAKSADALTQFEIDGLNLYLKDLGEKKLWMNQQAMSEPTPLSPTYVGKVQGLSQRGGRATGIQLDPMEIQEDIQVEPAASSMLAVDDEIRQNAAMKFYTLAVQDPANFDTNYAAEFLASTIRGVDPARAVKPPAAPQPPPPKANIAIAVKWPELPPDVQAQLIEGMGGQVTPEAMQELDEQQAMQDVQHVSAAADAAANLEAPPEHVMQMAQMEQSANEADMKANNDAASVKAKSEKKPNAKS
jgi:hypothetical protein